MEPFSKEHQQSVLRTLHDKGREYTPEQLMNQTEEEFKYLRLFLGNIGLRLPKNNIDLFLLIEALMKPVPFVSESCLSSWITLGEMYEMYHEEIDAFVVNITDKYIQNKRNKND